MGNIKKHKGFDVLIKAINEVNKRGFYIRLVLIGDYERIKTKDRYVMDLLKSAGDNILFTGVLSNNKLYDTVSKALALV